MGVTERPLGGYPVGKNAVGFKKSGTARAESSLFPVATAAQIFKPPIAGYWKFAAHAPGGLGSGGVSAGASGSYGEITRFLTPATPVTISVTSMADTVVTFADGLVCTAGKAALTVAGVATGFDLNINGTAGVLTGSNPGNPGTGSGPGAGGAASLGSGGAGAPGTANHRGGVGGSVTYGGVGAGSAENGFTHGQGLVEAIFIKP